MALNQFTTKPPPTPHCDKGAYCGGAFVPIEELGNRYKHPEPPKRPPPPRSRTRHCAAKADGSYDVIIIGAGVIGCSVARELSRTKASVLLLEADNDVGQGATKGNSGIIHAGYDDKPGSVRAKFCWPGNQMFPKLDEELNFGFFKNGSLVVARAPEEEATLEVLLKQGAQNGVQNLRIVKQDELRAMEPSIASDAISALYSPDAGIVIPYEFSIALAENAADNGVEVRIRRKVTHIEKNEKGYEITTTYVDWLTPEKNNLPLGIIALILSIAVHILLPNLPQWSLFVISLVILAAAYLYTRMTAPIPLFTTQTEEYQTAFVVNCAGGQSDVIAKMVGDDSFTIKPRYGEYLIAHKSDGTLVRHTLFPVPGPKGKGILAQRTLWGNACYGPTARDQHEATPSHDEIISHLVEKCRELIPTLDSSKIFHSFTGARAKSTRGDWIIEEGAPGFIHAAGIDSPGLAGSPAIALEVVRLLRKAGCSIIDSPNPNFNPNRAPIVSAKEGYKNLKMQKDVSRAFECKDPQQNVVCKCEKVTEAEVVEAIHRSLPVDNTQAIRRRTRAGMGDCQSRPDNYDCESRVKTILERELGKDHRVETRQWPGTSILPRRWLTDDDKQKLKVI